MFKCLEKNIKKGTRVRIKSCESSRHGKQVKGCICAFIGRIVTIGNLHWTNCVDAPPAYHVQIDGLNKLVSRVEVVILRDQSVKKKKKK